MLNTTAKQVIRKQRRKIQMKTFAQCIEICVSNLEQRKLFLLTFLRLTVIFNKYTHLRPRTCCYSTLCPSIEKNNDRFFCSLFMYLPLCSPANLPVANSPSSIYLLHIFQLHLLKKHLAKYRLVISFSDNWRFKLFLSRVGELFNKKSCVFWPDFTRTNRWANRSFRITYELKQIRWEANNKKDIKLVILFLTLWSLQWMLFLVTWS